MRIVLIIVSMALFTAVNSSCYAGCNCDDWVVKGGYCVDYVKSRIPSFPIPTNASEIVNLKNKETTKITEGDVAIFSVSNYWHVAYVEKVHTDKHGNATSIDVSEMNFGRQVSFDDYQIKWQSKDKREWNRALCCGITSKYDQISKRKYVSLDTVKQIWTPSSGLLEDFSIKGDDATLGKVRLNF